LDLSQWTSVLLNDKKRLMAKQVTEGMQLTFATLSAHDCNRIFSLEFQANLELWKFG